jgi:flagellar biosynthetic protein FliR
VIGPLPPTPIDALLAPGAPATLVCLLTRLGGMLLTGPLWSVTALPRTARAAVLVVLALVLLPGTPSAVLPEDPLALPFALGSELALGTAIGMLAAALVQGAMLAGEYAATQMGLAIAPTLAPMPEAQLSGVAQLQSLLAVAVFLQLNGHLALVSGVAESLRAVPPGTLVHMDAFLPALERAGLVMFETALRIGAPVLATLFLTNLAMAVLGRAVPHLNAMVVALPVSLAAGLLMTAIAMPLVAAMVARGTGALPDAISRMLAELAGGGR